MRILFDQGTPAPLAQCSNRTSRRNCIRERVVDVENGELLAQVEAALFDLFVTTDQNLRYQQNLRVRIVAILVLPTTRWPVIEQHTAEIIAAIDSIQPGEFRD